jgi:hypothetical protein
VRKSVEFRSGGLRVLNFTPEAKKGGRSQAGFELAGINQAGYLLQCVRR